MKEQPQIGHIVLAFLIVAGIYLFLACALAWAEEPLIGGTVPAPPEIMSPVPQVNRQSWSAVGTKGEGAMLILPSSPKCIMVLAGANIDGETALAAMETDCPK